MRHAKWQDTTRINFIFLVYLKLFLTNLLVSTIIVTGDKNENKYSLCCGNPYFDFD